MEKAFQRPFQRPTITRDISSEPGTNPIRLIIADGLARDPIELRSIVMPGVCPVAPKTAPQEMITTDTM